MTSRGKTLNVTSLLTKITPKHMFDDRTPCTESLPSLSAVHY